MGRDPRIVIANGVYHVYPRGNNRERIFFDDRDYRTLLLILGAAVAKYRLVLMAYCLMPNHVHLLVRVPDANLSAAMQFLNGGYARVTNARYGRSRHLFQNRFGGSHVTSDVQLVGALRYVARNPVEAGLAGHPAEWRWSSHRALAGLAVPPPYLDAGAALRFLGRDLHRARDAYRRLVERRS